MLLYAFFSNILDLSRAQAASQLPLLSFLNLAPEEART